MMEWLIGLDHSFFELINGRWHNGVLDAVLVPWRDKSVWIPVYIIIAVWLVYRYRWRGLATVITAGIAIGVSDQLSSHLIKPLVGRLRPCQDPEMMEQVRLLVGCGLAKSFPSSHAVNHFALSVFLVFQMAAHKPWLKFILLFWAAVVAWAQVYVGVHYPVDVISGAVLGSLIGWFFARLQQAIPPVRLPLP